MGGGDDREVFSKFGPSHLTSIDWTNSYHRTSVTSSLVKGVYVLELDREKNRNGSESRAKPWWEFFHFTLVETLIDQKDSSIYGGVFKYDLYNLYQNIPDLNAPPRYVIAFRGTNLAPETWLRDLKLNFQSFFHNLHISTRVGHAMQAIKTMVDKHGASAIWLAGHSLGAGLALLTGKRMAKSGFFLQSYVFNPPICSVPLEHLSGSKIVKGAVRISESAIKATLAKFLKDHQIQEDDPKTASWIPYLYVNESDPICSEYIGYFKHKVFMSKIGASKIERIGATISFRSLLVGINPSWSHLSPEPLHHLLSADMTVSTDKPTNFNTAHGIRQWWEKDSTQRANWKSSRIRLYPED